MGVRIDKWLWAARFFKTRSLAKKQVEQGKVKINDQKCKPSRMVAVDDRLSIKKIDLLWQVKILALSDRRGPAKIAQTLYEETAESIKNRTDQLALSKSIYHSTPRPEKRPTKKQRRDIKSFKSQNEQK